jgi:acyl-CoA synthetase (AMP-forming)/AMP-acid ligase II
VNIDVMNLSGRHAVNRWERTSVGDVIERVTWSYPDKEAIIGWEGAYGHPEFARLTYRQADELANRFANGLISRGLAQSDRVLLFCENSVEAFIAKIGIAKAGGVAVPINPSLAPDVVVDLISRTQPRFSVVDSELWVRAKEPFDIAVLGVDVTIPIGGGAIDRSLTFANFVAGQPSTEPDVVIHGDDIWELLFTSGTTAFPKGAMVSHSSTVMGAYSFALTLTREIHIECDLKLGTFLPIIYHVADQVFTFPAFLSGGTLLIGRRPVAESIAAAISAEQITALWAGSPAMVNALAKVAATESSGYNLRSLKVIVYGWAALPPATLQILKERAGADLVVVEIFGQTECISCHRFWPDKWPEVYERTAPEHNYVGVPNPMLASVVVDAWGESLESQPWVHGEAIYRSPAMAAGDYLDAAATAEAFGDGWFHSGDTCVYDEQGLRIMVDRIKDIIKSGGENVSTIRVEAILHQHPSVVKAAVIGVLDDRWGEAVTAVVVTSEPGVTSEAEIIAFCRERLAGFETPKSVIFVDALPETVGGKVLKYKLRQQFR